MVSLLCIVCDFLNRRFFMILWISLVLIVFYNTFTFYLIGRQFLYLRQILGLGLCISRGTANVINLCSALVLLPVCKKLNQVLYRVLSKFCPQLFFFWLERAKSFHMIVAVTLVLFSVIHSISHFVNLWNFSRGYIEDTKEANIANYKNESPIRLLFSLPAITGLAMLSITLSMGITSLRIVRRRLYNAFWFTHQLYFAFLVMFVIHPLRGVLKEEVLEDNNNNSSPEFSQIEYFNNNTAHPTQFVAIKSRNWMYMIVPLSCFAVDLIWRILSRNRNRVDIIRVTHMAGRTISLTLSCPHEQFFCRMGQYVLLQCLEISVLEWHPFTVVKVPTPTQPEVVVWIRVKGDWTESLEKLLVQMGPSNLRMLIDGPFSSPMQSASAGDVSICVAAGVGITPFVSILHHMLQNPRSRYPGRIHLLWIVRYDEEVTWLAELAVHVLTQLRNYNRPDRLNLEFYITNNNNSNKQTVSNKQTANTHMVVINKNGTLDHFLSQNDRIFNDEEKTTLLTPKLKRISLIMKENKLVPHKDNNYYDLCKEYPILGCRVRNGRPHWDKVFGYWVHLYPGQHLNLYCCGPKKLVKLLKLKCNQASNVTKTSFTFIHEGFA